MLPTAAAMGAATVTGIFGDGVASFTSWATVSETGYEVSISAAAALITGGSAAGSALKSAPSTGQKLNRSANCSWHVLQNFILTTSLSRWVSSAELKRSSMLLIDWRYEAVTR